MNTLYLKELLTFWILIFLFYKCLSLIFSLFRFQNDMCLTEQNNNGTCYTTEDCTAKGGLPQVINWRVQLS